MRDEVLRRDLAMKKVTNATVTGSQPGSASLASIDTMPLLVRRLLEEAQVTAQLDHSGVVPVHDLGIDDEGHVYFTMKKVRGRTLADVSDAVGRPVPYLSQLENGKVKTLGDAKLKVRLDHEKGAFINDSRVVTADIETTNGVIHVIDKVLLP